MNLGLPFFHHHTTNLLTNEVGVLGLTIEKGVAMTAREIRRRKLELQERLAVFELIKKETRDGLQALQKQCLHENCKNVDFLEGASTRTYTVCEDCDAQKRSWEEKFPS